jgi:hypothetical protein
MWHTIKFLTEIVGIEGGEEIASKGRDNTFNKRTTRSFPNPVIERKLLDNQTGKFRKRNSPRNIIFKTQNIQNEKDFINCKKEDISQL